MVGRGRLARGAVDDETAPAFGGRPVSSANVVIRHAFVQKVFGILSIQLCLSAVLAAGVRHLALRWMAEGAGNSLAALLFLTAIGSTVVLCAARCYPHLMRRYPTNYALLLAFTVLKGGLVGLICAAYTLDSVLLALGITAVLALSLTVFACQTKYDFTGCGPYLFCGAMVLMCFAMIFFVGSMLGLGNNPVFETMHLIYAVGGALLFSCYLVYDTQLIVGGKHRYQYSVDDYAMAALNLYIDISQLFLFILRIVGKRR